ncbi:MAG TPA: Hsp20/alpha crystallin family protein [Ktedonobacteraceae bacterium]|jgi:HSP20 family protein|nr:Hsp20/alpha crystallin family protein [Ktedonobacteraceae bacterium]
MANLTRYSPFNEMVSLREAMDRLFEDSFISPRLQGQWSGRGMGANLFETSEGFILQVPMPGVKAEDVEITAQQDTLSLKWQTSIQVPEGAAALWQGFQNGQYQQSFSLPSPINADRAEAHYTDGILTLNLPKAEHAKARTVKVNAK